MLRFWVGLMGWGFLAALLDESQGCSLVFGPGFFIATDDIALAESPYPHPDQVFAFRSL